MKKLSFKAMAGLFLLAGFVLMSCLPAAEKKPVKVYLIGDSIMSKKEVKAYPETGWGMPFAYFFDETVTVENHAQNGRSTRTFIEENRWQPIADKLQEGDYVFIQFGHNDEIETKKSYTPKDQYRANLIRFVNETRKRKATPVLVTPAARRHFDNAGKLENTHAVYSEIVRDVARKLKTPFIDLDKKSQELVQGYGVEKSKLLYNILEPGEHPFHPEGKEDNTHFNELGARHMAQIIAAEVKAQNLELANRFLKR